MADEAESYLARIGRRLIKLVRAIQRIPRFVFFLRRGESSLIFLIRLYYHSAVWIFQQFTSQSRHLGSKLFIFSSFVNLFVHVFVQIATRELDVKNA